MNFENKTVLVTGASSGIGYTFARKLAFAGVDLVITARRSERLEELASAIREDIGRKVHIITCDLSNPGSAAKLFNEIQSRGIKIDILINNAGFGYQGDFLDTDCKTYNEMIQVNITALTELTCLLLPQMKENRSGGIINIASMAGISPIPYFCCY